MFSAATAAPANGGKGGVEPGAAGGQRLARLELSTAFYQQLYTKDCA